MTDKIKLSDVQLLGIVGLIVGVTGAVAGFLNFYLHADLATTLLASTFTPGALILLLYLGHLVCTAPASKAYMKLLKALAGLSVMLGMLLFLDANLPANSVELAIKAKIPHSGGGQLDLGRYEVEVSAEVLDAALEGDPVTLKVTPIFNRILHAKFLRGADLESSQAEAQRRGMFVAALVFLYPIMMFFFSPRAELPVRTNLTVYFLAIVPSYIISLVAMVIWLKLVLVHFLGLIPRM